MIGPPLGGLLIALGGWRMTLAVNVPLALACLVLGVSRLPRTAPLRREEGSLDLPGIALFALSLLALLLALMEWRSWWPAVIVAAGCVAFAALELRRRDPFIDLRMLAATGRSCAPTRARCWRLTVSYSVLYGFTQWTEEGRGLSASAAGLLLLPMSLVAIAVSARPAAVPGCAASCSSARSGSSSPACCS